MQETSKLLNCEKMMKRMKTCLVSIIYSCKDKIGLRQMPVKPLMVFSKFD